MKTSALFSRNGKSFWLLLGILIFSAGTLSAQDCNAIVLPLVKYDANRLAQYPADKIAFYCAVSQFSFEVADDLPTGVPMYEINEVRDIFSGKPLDKDVKIVLNELSYYQYDFNRFQVINPNQTIYFHTPGSEHLYLVLLTRFQAEKRAHEKMVQESN